MGQTTHCPFAPIRPSLAAWRAGDARPGVDAAGPVNPARASARGGADSNAMMAHVRGDVLRWLTTSVVVAGAVAIVGAFLAFDDGAASGGVHARLLAALLLLVAVGSFASVRVRLQSAVVAVAWTDAAVLVCVVS